MAVRYFKLAAKLTLVGKRVVIIGTSREDLNGRAGAATSFDDAKDRYVVELDADGLENETKGLLLKLGNLSIANDIFPVSNVGTKAKIGSLLLARLMHQEGMELLFCFEMTEGRLQLLRVRSGFNWWKYVVDKIQREEEKEAREAEKEAKKKEKKKEANKNKEAKKNKP